MSKNLPSNAPGEILDISPEYLEIANCFLQNQDVTLVAELLGIPVALVTQSLAHKHVKAYVDNVFMNLGFNNQFKMRAAMDAILKTKFRELEEAEVGSSKDIIEIMALSHKMSMDYLAAQMALEKVQNANVKSQVNVQINEAGGDGTRYGKLIQQLVNLDDKC